MPLPEKMIGERQDQQIANRDLCFQERKRKCRFEWYNVFLITYDK